MSSVFISYRRQTASGEARALFNDLVARLGESAVFMDVDSISLGRDFRSELQKTLAACDLMLVIIDKDWAAVKSWFTGREYHMRSLIRLVQCLISSDLVAFLADKEVFQGFR